MKKIMTVIGARPQFVKAAIVSQFMKQSGALNEVMVHTGQHYDANMSKIFFDELDMSPAHHQLGIGSSTQGRQTAEMIIGIEQLLATEKPDLMLIYGDTNSTLAGALAAIKCHIPIAHVEAGLRSYNRKMPEEINRVIADQLSAILFTPTAQAVHNLKKEGFDDKRIVSVGDVMYDAALFYGKKAQEKSDVLHSLQLKPHEYILATIHRAENTDDPNRLKNMFTALNRLAEQHKMIMPLHPRTRKLIEMHFEDVLKKTKINIVEPVGFLDMMMLEKNAALIVTDSGGVQKEAFFYQIPCVTLRDETEWVETVELGWNTLVSPDQCDAIYETVLAKINSHGKKHDAPFGRGNASDLIATYLKKWVE